MSAGPGQIGDTLASIQAYILGELNADCEVRPSYVILFGNTAHVPTCHVPCSEGGDVAECSIPSDLPYRQRERRGEQDGRLRDLAAVA